VIAYPTRRAPLPIELASTIYAVDGQVHDALATPDGLQEWLALNGLEVPAAARYADDFRALREAVRAVLTTSVERGTPPPSVVELLNECSAAAPGWRRLDWTRAAPSCADVELATDPARVALAVVARATIELLCGGDRERIRLCRAPGCVLFFLKEGGRREWCSAQCGNRARVARHYARHRRAQHA
jgi:predicted RNA-binding Zn ribbon-like protein